jgi:hypothetical protein
MYGMEASKRKNDFSDSGEVSDPEWSDLSGFGRILAGAIAFCQGQIDGYLGVAEAAILWL